MPHVTYALVVVFALLSTATTAKNVTFSNTSPRFDASGNILNAHDGPTRQYSPGGPFYYHAMAYGLCNETGKVDGCTDDCIFGPNEAWTWTSPDLSSGSWVRGAPIFIPNQGGVPDCGFFRTQVLQNAATGVFVAWVNAGTGCSVCPSGYPRGNTSGQDGYTCYLTATAPGPQGPWEYQGAIVPNATLTGPPGWLGDYALFADEDGTAYAIITHGIAGAEHRDTFVFKLSADYLSFEANFSGPLTVPFYGTEGLSFFRRGTFYYAFLSGCSCAGLYGGGVTYLTAPTPLGPWTTRSAALDPGCPMQEQTHCEPPQVGPGQVCNPVSQAQGNFVIEIPLVGGGVQYVWTGDRWQDAPDHLLGHDPQTWFPLTFEDNGDIVPFEWVDSFVVDVETNN